MSFLGKTPASQVTSGQQLANGTVTPSKLSPGAPAWDSSGNLVLPGALTAIGQQNIPSINLSAGQIKFPAAQNPSSDANTLDDYEEGTWTPTIVSGGGTISGTGYYTKVGRLVTVSIDAGLGGTRNGTVFQIGGLPFVNKDWAACSFYCSSYAAEGVQQVSGTFTQNATTVQFDEFGNGAIGTQFGNGYLNIAGSYTQA